jgi:hypothetical protein
MAPNSNIPLEDNIKSKVHSAPLRAIELGKLFHNKCISEPK